MTLSFGKRLIAAYLALCLLIGGLTAWSIWEARMTALASANATTANLAKTISYGITSTFDRIDYALLVVADEFQRQSLAGKSNDLELRSFMRRQEARIPSIHGILVADRQGILTHGEGVERQNKVSIADRAYFAELRGNPDTGVVISDPVLGRLTGTPQIVVARSIHCANGGFCGVAFAPIYLDQFSNRFSKLNLGPHGGIALRNRQSALVARYPTLTGEQGKPGNIAVSAEVKQFLENGQATGNYIADAPTDRIRRINTYQLVPGTPFYLVVGLSIDDYLMNWYRQTAYTIAFVALFLVFLAGGFWKLYRYWLQRLALENEIHTLAFYDPLTHLANRRLFYDRLAQTRAQRSREHHAVLYLDLDNFKELNDALGHNEGDHALELVAQRLNAAVREGDTVSRFGGDEFVLLLADLGQGYETAVANALAAADKVRNVLNIPHILHGAPGGWVCSPSIGIAVFRGQTESRDEILKRADQALFEAKHAGRDTVRISHASHVAQYD